MTESVPKPGEMQELGRLPSGRIEAPDRYIEYEGQVIVRTRYATSQRWVTEGWDHGRNDLLPYLLDKRYCTGESDSLAPRNDHLEADHVQVYYVEDSETVFYRVVEDD